MRNIFKSTAVVFMLSFVSKIIGFFKSIVQAHIFGADIYTDAFNVANGFVGNILFMFTTSIAVAFVPLYIQRKKSGNEKAFVCSTFTFFAVAGLVVTVILAIFSDPIVRLIAPSFNREEIEITSTYFRVLICGFVFSLIANLYTSLLNAEKIYGYSALGSVVNSIVLIVFVFLFYRIIGIWTLVLSVPASYLIQWVLLYRKGKQFGSISMRYGIRNENIKILLMQAFPIMISQATVEINQVIDRALLSSVGVGVVTAVSYSAVLYQFVTTLIGAPLTSVLFTELSEAGANGNKIAIGSILNLSYKLLVFICVPIIFVLLYSAHDIVEIVYGHGNFTIDAVANCSIGLKMYGLCLLPVCIKKVLSNSYYAVSDTRRPMVFGVLEVILNVCLSLAMVQKFGIYGVIGATSIASIIFFIVMTIDYNFKHIKFVSSKEVLSYWKFVAGAVILGVCMNFVGHFVFQNVLIAFLVKSICAFLIYFFALLFLKEKTIKIFYVKVVSSLLKK